MITSLRIISGVLPDRQVRVISILRRDRHMDILTKGSSISNDVRTSHRTHRSTGGGIHRAPDPQARTWALEVRP